VLFKVYYRGLWKKELRQFNVTTASAAQAIETVESVLAEEQEQYHKPVLALVQGGKE